MAQRGDNKNGVRLRDENNLAYGVKQTDNCPHVLIAGNTSDATPMDVYLQMKSVSGTLGSLDAEICLENHTEAMGSLVFQVSGTWKGKIVIEGAIDGTYNNLSIVQPAGTITFTGINNDNQNGIYRCLMIAGYTHVRLRMSSYTSGTASVVMNAAPLTPTSYSWQLVPANLNGRMEVLGADGATVATVEARKQTPTGNALNVQIGPGDIISNIPVMITFEHHQVHEGEAFMAQYVDTSLDTNTVKFGLTTGAGAATTKSPHLAIDCDVYNGAVRLDLYAEATFTNGSPVTVVNRNRNVAVPAGTMTVASGVTSTNGTLIESHFVGAGSRSAGSAGTRDEWILKPSTIYRIDLTGLAAGTDAILHLNWYEDLGV